jgi:hypothetical protein
MLALSPYISDPDVIVLAYSYSPCHTHAALQCTAIRDETLLDQQTDVVVVFWT